jgi:hypothetical protein
MSHNARSSRHQRGTQAGKEARVLQDLEVLTPSLVVCAAFLIAVVMFLRRQMGAKRPTDAEGPADIPDDSRNAAASEPQQPPSGGRAKP